MAHGGGGHQGKKRSDLNRRDRIKPSDKPKGWKPSMGYKKVPRKPGDVRDRSRVTKGPQLKKVTPAQVRADDTIGTNAKKTIIKALRSQKKDEG